MRLDPQVAKLRSERIACGARPVSMCSVQEAREEEARGLWPCAAPYEPLTAPGPGGPIPLRLYRPANGDAHGLPVLVWLYGGGWVMGSLDAAAPVCARLAEQAGCAVVAVEYRPAPEHRFPAAVDDCLAATRWIRDRGRQLGLDSGRVALGGASAGGTLAAVVALLETRLALQVLVYPITAYRSRTPSLAARGDPYFLDEAALEWVWSHYLPEHFDPNDLRISPLHARDVRGLPPALVLVAGHDPLHDEGVLYAKRLEAAGIETELLEFPGMAHGFFGWAGRVDAADEAQTRVAHSLRRAFAGPSPR